MGRIETVDELIERAEEKWPSEEVGDWDLSVEQVRLYFRMSDHYFETVREMALKMDIPNNTVYRVMRKFVDLGLVDLDTRMVDRQRRVVRYRRRFVKVELTRKGVVWTQRYSEGRR